MCACDSSNSSNSMPQRPLPDTVRAALASNGLRIVCAGHAAAAAAVAPVVQQSGMAILGLKKVDGAAATVAQTAAADDDEL